MIKLESPEIFEHQTISYFKMLIRGKEREICCGYIGRDESGNHKFILLGNENGYDEEGNREIILLERASFIYDGKRIALVEDDNGDRRIFLQKRNLNPVETLRVSYLDDRLESLKNK